MRLLEINLLPAEFRKAKADLSWVVDRRIVWPTILLVVAVMGSFFAYLHIRDTIASLNEQLASVKSEIEREKPLLEKIKVLDEKLTVIGQKNKALKSIQVSKKRWVILFENISSVLPPNMWLANLSDEGANTLTMQGKTYDFSEVAEYMVSLERQVSFTTVSLVSINNEVIGTDKAFAFTLKCSINPDLGMEEQGK